MISLRGHIIGVLLLLFLSSLAFSKNGSGDFKIGYIYLDEVGNRSINQSSFNYYDGLNVSLEKFRYRLKNGIQFRADLKNISLNNRNLSFNLLKSGLFGADFKTSQFRRIYDFEGDKSTRRNLTASGLWFYPQRYVKLYASGTYNNISGNTIDMFSASSVSLPIELDYKQQKYTVGSQFNYQGRMFQAEYSTISYKDKNDESKDQTRRNVRLIAALAVPRFEWLQLSGGFQQFKTEYCDTKFGLKSTTVQGGGSASLPHNFSVKYNIFFNRAGSDSDFVETDNVSQTVYLSYSKPKLFSVTAGYQNDIRDDFEDSFKANSYYFSGLLYPNSKSELRSEVGIRAEDVDQGSRLIGNEDRNKYKISGKYKIHGNNSIGIKYEARERKNEQISSQADFSRIAVETYINSAKYAQLMIGYSYTVGDYKNSEQEFKFADHQVNLDINSAEYKKFTGGFGLTYYRSQRDLDIESVGLRFKGGYKLMRDYRIEAFYNVYNFDDLLAFNQYYTENMVEFNIIKKLSL